jgi:EmrB/QacA subfamily drug resistance transporter
MEEVVLSDTQTVSRPTPAQSAPRRSSATITFVILAVSAASFSMLQSLINPVLSTIQRELHTDQNTVTWVLTAWLLSSAIATPLLGRVGDMIGKKRTLLLALTAIAVGSLIATFAPTIGLLIVGRIVQGLGGAVFPLSFGIIRDEFPAARVASAVGILSAVIAVGGGLGTVLAGPIVAGLGWRSLFWVPAVAVIITGILAVFIVPESPIKQGGRINWLAAALLAGWLVALLLPLSEASQWGWASPGVIGLFVVAAALIVSWVIVESRSSNPLIDMKMMRLPTVWTTNLVALLFGAGLFAGLAFLPELLQTPASSGYGFGLSLTDAGLVILPMLVMMAVTGFISGPIAPYVSFKTQLAIASALIALSGVGFAFFHAEIWTIMVAGTLFGLGLGFGYAAMTSLIVQGVPTSQTGVASGMNANIRTIGGAIGTAVFSSIVTSQLLPSGLPAEGGYTAGFVMLASVSVVAFVVSFLVPRSRSTRYSVADEIGSATPLSAEAG